MSRHINEIRVSKAKVHNLKGIDVVIPRNSLTVITGPSGSGKSSLAFDTIYAEGQRRYIESLSSYARQFLGQQNPPDVESITGLSPSIAIDQKTSSRNPRSTVGTITEIYDYLRIFYARLGKMICHKTKQEIRSYSPHQTAKELLSLKEKTKLHIMAPIHFKTKKDIDFEIKKFLSLGMSRFRINGEIVTLEDHYSLPKSISSLEVVIDRLVIRDGIEKRLTDSVELAMSLSQGTTVVLIDEELKIFSEKMISPVTGEVLPDLSPRLFSFNSPVGACAECNGVGVKKSFDPNRIITDESLSIDDGAIGPISKKNTFLQRMVYSVLEEEGVKTTIAYKKISPKIKKILMEGTDKVYRYKFESDNSHFEFKKNFPGIVNWLEKKYLETSSENTRKSLEDYMNVVTCQSCKGKRLRPEALSTIIHGKNIIEVSELSIKEAFKFLSNNSFEGEQKIIASKLLSEILGRLNFLLDVGLGYLTLNRSAQSLSGGESQRIRLATQIGSALSGVLYVLDEPSIGLHQRDNQKLIQTLKNLRDLGNTVLVVEHDEETMLSSDYLIDMGTGAGLHGGEIVAFGPTQDFLKKSKGLTADYLSGKLTIEIPSRRELHQKLILKGAQENNLNNVSVEIPLQVMTCITGVSGSGKSTLIHQVLVPAVKANSLKSQRLLYHKNNYSKLIGIDEIKQVIELDQSPIGRTPHSNPATYTGLFDEIRKLFASTTEAQIRGYRQGRFSFNIKGGRCEECEGNGVKKIEMHFLPDVYITCSECGGTRYNRETLSVLYKSKNIADILNLSIEEAAEFFQNHQKIYRVLSTLCSVGLGYMKLGQPATTLSGGEAQRLKLSRELAKSTKGHCLYVLDEPTTGLHFNDIKTLLMAMHRLVDLGHTLIVIEHNLDVIKTADFIIDLGPEGGDGGCQIVASGRPEDIVKNKNSYTGKFLAPLLKRNGPIGPKKSKSS